eukprot:1192491-Prorocentrum_minimum.AAC.4
MCAKKHSPPVGVVYWLHYRAVPVLGALRLAAGGTSPLRATRGATARSAIHTCVGAKVTGRLSPPPGRSSPALCSSPRALAGPFVSPVVTRALLQHESVRAIVLRVLFLRREAQIVCLPSATRPQTLANHQSQDPT